MQLDEGVRVSTLGHRLVRAVRLLFYMKNTFSIPILCCEQKAKQKAEQKLNSYTVCSTMSNTEKSQN